MNLPDLPFLRLKAFKGAPLSWLTARLLSDEPPPAPAH